MAKITRKKWDTDKLIKQPEVREEYESTVCPQSPFGVLKNCGAQTN
jgi:hypothetical protein